MTGRSIRKAVLLLVAVSVLTLVSLIVTSYWNQQQEDQPYLIGISQPNLNEPRQVVMNNEIRKEAERHSNVRLIFTDAAENSEKQIHDVQKLMTYGVDLLIISLNDPEKLTPVVTEAYKSIPVIVLGRGVTGYDYTLFIGPDNASVGRKSGQLAERILGDSSAEIIEIQGIRGSKSVEETSRGFEEYVSRKPKLSVVRTVVGNWQRDRAEDEMAVLLPAYPNVRLVFAHSDAMALGAYRALQTFGMQHVGIIGIDGLDTVNGGFELVRKGILNGSVTSPTGGKESIQYALDILQRVKGIPKKIILRSHLITGEQASGEAQEGNMPSLAGRQIGDGGRKIRLGVAVVGSESSWRNANTESIKQAVEQEKQIELFMRNAEGSQQKQIEIIRGFIAQQVDVITFTPIVETGWDEVLQEAKQAGIPVLLSDRKVKVEDDSLWTTFIGSDFIEEGRRAARWLVEDTKASGKPVRIVELQGTPGSAPAIERKQGFEEVIAEHQAMLLVDSKIGDFTYDSGQGLMESILRQGIRPDAVFAHNDDMAFGAIKAIEAAGLRPGKDIRVISVDATKLAFQAMMAGKLNVSVECNPLLGPQITKAVKDLASGKELPVHIITEEGIFTQETAHRELTTRRY
ncbi:substrate-binding domain-containing protein [Paenibacillus filicis]|uniref:Substrate-binding domain-containing protein n=1 Tax=Paenibacillus filicis TaxID=669464 RepID=A0ABU9DGZ8_9BACL